MSKHTPGPWIAEQQLNPEGKVLSMFDICTNNEKPRYIGEIPREDNARLISASPDLLDALQRVMRHIPDNAGGASLSDDMHRAKKAIAKATGGQP